MQPSSAARALHEAGRWLVEFKATARTSSEIDQELISGTRRAIQSSRDLMDEIDRTDSVPIAWRER
jgi:hypothetical protein